MTKFEEFEQIIYQLRGEHGCPWDRVQTHASLKGTCMEEAAEVVCGINILENTGNGDNLKEELGDLLMQVVMLTHIAEEKGLFNMDDVIDGISDKMLRRHPHVFGDRSITDRDEIHRNWENIKRQEKQGKEWMDDYVLPAMDEAIVLIEAAKQKKAEKLKKNGDN